MSTPHVALAQPAATPTADQATEAKAHFAKGKTLFAAKNFADALSEFRASYAIVKSPNSHFLIANCLRDLGRLSEAYVEYDRVVVEAKAAGEDYAGAVDAAAAERDALAPKLVMVNVTTPADAADAMLVVGGMEVTSDMKGKPIPAMPGNIEVTLSPAGKAPVTQSVTGAAGETKSVTLEFAAEAPPEDTTGGGKKLTPMRIGAIAAAGVGVVGMVIFAVQGSASNTTFDSLKEKCGSSPCPQDLAADVDKGKTQQLTANIGLGLGIVGLGVGATLFALSMKKKPDATQPQTTWLIGPGSLGVRGTF